MNRLSSLSKRQMRVFLFIVLALSIFLLFKPLHVHAALIDTDGGSQSFLNQGIIQAGGTPGTIPTVPSGELQSLAAGIPGSTAADLMCTPVDVTCPCGFTRNSKGLCETGTPNPAINKFLCPGSCVDTTNGFPTTGHCVALLKCQADTFTGLGGALGNIGTLAGLGMQVGQLFKGLFSGGSGSGSGSGSGTGIGGTGAFTGCTSYYQVSTPSSDPCAYYVPVSTTIGNSTTGGAGSTISDDLLKALSGGGTTNNGGTNTNTNNNTNTNTNTNPISTQLNTNTLNGVTVASSSAFSNPALSSGGTIAIQSGISGNLVITESGTTFYASSQDSKSNSVTAGFYGSNTSGLGESQGVVANMCASRPWTSNFLSYVIPPSFFDGLCTWRGYKVGTAVAPVKTTTKTITTTVIKRPVIKTTVIKATTTVPTIPPKVEIWAVPPAVSIGARTSIFWSTQGVSSCTETSPDGSFAQRSLSGGASTVPITSATTFTISCLTPDNQPVTGYVTVTIKI
jgi:hypothetical protein